MKRFVIFFSILCMLSLPVSVIAESVDVSSMSYDELFALQEAIRNELSERTKELGEPFYAGYYVAGESIKSGSWTIQKDDDDESFYYAVFASTEDYEEGNILANMYDRDPCSVTISLTDGMILVVECQAKMYITQSIGSWAP